MRLPLLSLPTTGVLADVRIDRLEKELESIFKALGEERQEDDDRFREFLLFYFQKSYHKVAPQDIPYPAEAVMRAYNMHRLFGMERFDDGELLDPNGTDYLTQGFPQPLQLQELDYNSDKQRRRRWNLEWGRADAERRLSKSSLSYEEFES